jgi:acetoin utilization deacetylase AcuC-like enzyme
MSSLSSIALFYTDHFELPLPETHRFPMSKYRLLRERIVREGMVAESQLHVPAPAQDDQLLLAHSSEYLGRVIRGELSEEEVRRIGFPWTLAMVERSRRSTGATIAAGRRALTDGLSINLAGGTHHAFRDAGEGFCVFNDVAVAARVMQREGRIGRAVVLDCDVHQGNGTAAIFADDPTVFTFSIHGARNFPRQKQPGNFDIFLPDGTTDDVYLPLVEFGIRESIGRSNADMAFYLAGADPYEGDRYGRLGVSKQGLLQRDQIAIRLCQEAGLPLGGRHGRRIRSPDRRYRGHSRRDHPDWPWSRFLNQRPGGSRMAWT